MRTFEWVELAVVAAATLGPVLAGRRLKRGRAAPLFLAAVAAQWIIEGFRWQLLPLHLTAVGLAIGDVVWDDRRVAGFLRFRRAALGPAGVLLLAVLPAIFPVPEVPRPTGPFDVGTSTVVLVDRDRDDPFPLPDPESPETESPEPRDPRRLVVQVWYPAEPEDGREPVVWNDDWDVVGPALSRRLGLPWFFLDHLADVRGHAVEGATPLSGRLPVVLYAHGWTGFRTIALNQMESLASHGFVVIAADHTHGAVATRFPDGEVVPYDEAALPMDDHVDLEDLAEAQELLVETFAEDLRSLLDELEEGSSGAFGELADHVDLDAVGVLGHSIGGGAAVRLCIDDERCDSVVGFDPVVEAVPDRLVANELEVPSMFVRSDAWRGTANDRRLRGIAERSPSPSWWVGIAGAHHSDFVMTPFLSPYADRLGLRGPVEADVVERVLDDYLAGFFDRTLLGVGGAVLDEVPPPTVDVEHIP